MTNQNAVIPKQSWLVLAATVLASSLAFIDSSVVNVALPALARDLAAGADGLQWTINVYLLPLSAVMLFGGAAGDRFGRRRLLLLGTIVFASASLGCALAPNLTCLLIARFLCTPNASWKRQKVTDRFVKFYEETIPDHLDAMIEHPDFDKVFDIKRGRRTSRTVRRALLNAMYEYRSVRVLSASLRDIVDDTRKREDQQRTFFCVFAEAAILSYLAAPRSSFIGSPDTSRPIRQLASPRGP
jgi:hypothetical protein